MASAPDGTGDSDLLRAFVPEHGPDVVQTLTALVQESVLVDGSNDTSSCPQDAVSLSPLRLSSKMNFLFDDVSDLTQTAHKQRGGLK